MSRNFVAIFVYVCLAASPVCADFLYPPDPPYTDPSFSFSFPIYQAYPELPGYSEDDGTTSMGELRARISKLEAERDQLRKELQAALVVLEYMIRVKDTDLRQMLEK